MSLQRITKEEAVELLRKTHELGLVHMALSVDARAARIPCAMATFGEVAFSLVYKDEAEEVAKLFEAVAPGYQAVIAGIDNESAKLVGSTTHH
jgi:hypothetical protein